MRDYDSSSPLSILAYSRDLLGNSLAQILPIIDNSIDIDELNKAGKGGLAQMVEKYYFGYEPNSDPRPDFIEAGVELKVSALKKNHKNELAIKERLVCDMIDYCALVEEDFENSRFFKKSMLMLIMFYLHVSGCPKKDLQFIYSILG